MSYAVAYCQWSDGRPSSGAFSDAYFSVDIVSRVKSIEETANRFPGYGLVEFNCGTVRPIGFDTRDEKDPRTSGIWLTRTCIIFGQQKA